MRVAILGSGGREHAIAWRLSKDSVCQSILVIPGNPGMRKTDKVQTIDADLKDFSKIANLIRNNGIDYAIVGPEAPLASGIVDYFDKIGIKVVGPTKAMALLESSKAYSKDFMNRYGIKAAHSECFSDSKKAINYIEQHKEQALVIKASELAAGKGVFVCSTKEEAKEAVHSLLDDQNFSINSKEILVEDTLKGVELSAFALYDGKSYINLGFARDYKRAHEGDLGPNTGGMGTFSDISFNDQKLIQKINTEVFDKVLEGSLSEGTPYRGILFAGLMIDGEDINVIEFNVRLGDPETQSLLPRIKGDLTSLFYLSTIGRIDYFHKNLEFESLSSVHVVMCSEYYPAINGERMTLGEEISLPLECPQDSLIFFAGVSEKSGQLVNSGGRVLGVTGLGKDIEAARLNAYKSLAEIKFNGSFFRGDIGKNV